MYHLRLTGNHYEMGVKRGKIFNRRNITFPFHLDDFQKNTAMKAKSYCKNSFPRYAKK